MADIINIPADPYTSETVYFSTVAGSYLNSSVYVRSTGIGRGQHARVAFMHLESSTTGIRIHISGKTAAAACGIYWVTGDYLTLDSPSAIRNFNGIGSAAGASATAVVFYYF